MKFGLSAKATVDLRKYLKEPRLDLLTSENNCWRPLHYLVSEEIIKQTFSKKDDDSWTDSIHSFALEIIDFFSDASQVGVLSENNNKVISFLSSLFLERREQSIEQKFAHFGQKDRSKFSDYINKIPTIEGKKVVFEKLTREFSTVPHFWGHYSRFLSTYSKSQKEFIESIEAVEKAIELSKVDAPAILHMKGMTLSQYATFMMNLISTKKQKGEQFSNLSQELESIESIVEQALSVFTYIREELGMLNETAFVPAIELLTRYIEFRKSISSFNSYAEFLKSPQNKNFVSYLAEAEQLLRRVKRLQHGKSRENFYIEERINYLNRLYDDYDLFIKGLQKLVASLGSNRTKYRRSIANAYISKHGRNWDNIPTHNLVTIQELMEENFLVEPSNPHNFEFWFAAVRRLNSVTLDFAISKISEWIAHASNTEILDAHYYHYILHSIVAIESANNEDAKWPASKARKALSYSRKLSENRFNRTFSLEWLGKGKGVGRLIPFSKVDKLNKETIPNVETSQLERCVGRVLEIKSKQQGTIHMKGLNLFFPPSPRVGEQFLREKDINQKVSFFVAFSYDGLRAWDVKTEN